MENTLFIEAGEKIGQAAKVWQVSVRGNLVKKLEKGNFLLPFLDATGDYCQKLFKENRTIVRRD